MEAFSALLALCAGNSLGTGALAMELRLFCLKPIYIYIYIYMAFNNDTFVLSFQKGIFIEPQNYKLKGRRVFQHCCLSVYFAFDIVLIILPVKWDSCIFVIQIVTCQILMWFKESNRYFCKTENFAYGEIKDWGFNNPIPGPQMWYRIMNNQRNVGRIYI